MSLDTTIIDNGAAYIKKARDLVDEQFQAQVDTVLAGIANAKEAMADNEEKLAYLNNMVTNWATQITSMVFCDNKLTPELEAEFRTLPNVKETSAKAKEFQDARQARIDEINAKQAEVSREQKGIDIFMAIANGMSKEEAKAKMEEYEQQAAQAMQQVAR